MRLFIVRHGDAEHIQRQIIAGWKNVNLTELGQKQALELANKLKNKNIDYIFSSDLARTQQTANIIAQELKVPVASDWLLRERNNGQLEGQSKQEINWQEINNDLDKMTQLDIENFSNMDNRAKAFLNNLKLFPKQLNNIVMVSHNGFINNLLGVIDTNHQFRKISHMEVIELEIDLESINE